jgi:hypothetical protein
MYIATLKKPYDLDNLNPSDRRHIAIALNKKEIENLLSDSEKKFRKKKNTQKTIK